MPPTNAFSGFATDIPGNKNPRRWNVQGYIPNSIEKTPEDLYTNYGLHFWTNNSHTSTIYFPCTNDRGCLYLVPNGPARKRQSAHWLDWSHSWTARGLDRTDDS